ncbi:conserved hypothetical protein [Ricinus communis]|uniref:Uncharacterized protein n=1 Tax=Ricinus communis TaxID=3988 RepID=B9RSE4_RICCO|nr:conserved hypothetical protein [Ricinus communis]
MKQDKPISSNIINGAKSLPCLTQHRRKVPEPSSGQLPQKIDVTLFGTHADSRPVVEFFSSPSKKYPIGRCLLADTYNHSKHRFNLLLARAERSEKPLAECRNNGLRGRPRLL